jgi:hypothetical protein
MPLSRINSASIANSAVIAADIADGTITAAKIISVANTQITGNIVSSQITSVGGSQITANTIANSAIQTGAVENYLRGANLDFGMRNRIINGAMVIDQRNAGAAITAGGFPVDRWSYGLSGTPTFSIQQNGGSVTPPAGFINYLGATSTSAYSMGSTDRAGFFQGIEGLNVADLGWGTANAKTVTLSAWVRSSLTGTFGGVVANSSYNRCYVFSYTISAANTWEYKTITIAGDTTGTWLTNNNAGINLSFAFGAGSGAVTTAGSWGSTAFFAPTGQVNVAGTNGATFYITGVQLEVGSTATSFDYRQCGTELALCQRYFEKSFALATAPANGLDGAEPGGLTAFSNGSGRTALINFCVPKRAASTITYYRSQLTGADGQWHYYNASGAGWTSATSTITQNASQNCFVAVVEKSGSFSSGTAYLYAGGWTASAEL